MILNQLAALSPSLVSVIIPTHNRAPMLSRAIKSVLEQTYTNIEVIIIADYCTDHTKDTIKSFNDKRINFIELDKNVGGAQARNIGLDNAVGEYVAFLDDDDEWLADKITSQIQIFEENNDIAIVSCNYVISDEKKMTEKINNYEIISSSDLKYDNYCGSFSFCMTKNKHIKRLRINPDLNVAQDWDLWLKILLKTGLKCKVVKMPLVRYNIGHEDRLTNSHKKAIKSYILFLKHYWPLMNDSQRNFQLYKLMKWKRKYFYSYTSYFYNLKLFIKALKHYKKSGHDNKFSKYLLLLPQLLKFSRLVSR